MNWRLKRQLIAVGIMGLFAAIIVFSLYFWFGGTTSSNNEVKPVAVSQPLRLLWSRFFFVRQGVYDVAALLENPNANAKAAAVPYAFRLFDESDILIAAKEGVGFVNPGERFVIVEPLVTTGVRAPKRVSFEIRDITWEAGEKRIVPVTVKEKRFEISGTDTTVRVILVNSGVKMSAPLEVVSVLADEEGNATAVSRAIVDSVLAGGEREIVFTWPARPSVGTGGPRALPEPNVIQVYVRER